MKLTTVLILLLVGAVGISSCHHLFDDDDDHDHTSHEQGVIKGNTLLVDSTGVLLTDHSGIIITMTGKTHSDIDTTDANGDWRFEHVPAGIYSFTMNKPGFGGEKFENLEFVGNAEFTFPFLFKPYSMYLGRIPSFNVNLSDFRVDSNFGSTFSLVMKVSAVAPPTYTQHSIVVFSHNPVPSPTDSLGYAFSRYFDLSVSDVPELSLDAAWVKEKGFKSGDTCYVAAFGIGQTYQVDNEVVALPSSYAHPKTGHQLFTATGPSSNVIQFIMP